MRLTILVSAIALLLSACDSKKRVGRDEPPASSPQRRATAPLVDLTTASTLTPVRDAFNAHKAEARFLTLLSPT